MAAEQDVRHVSQARVREWWNRNPMSYDVDDPIPHQPGTQEYFRELDARVFHPRVLRLTAGRDGRPFSRFVDFVSLAGKARGRLRKRLRRVHFEGARAGEREGLIARHFTRRELIEKLQRAGLHDVRIGAYGQDAELLPLPRRIRVPITDRLPMTFKDRVLLRLGHQLGAAGRKRP